MKSVGTWCSDVFSTKSKAEVTESCMQGSVLYYQEEGNDGDFRAVSRWSGRLPSRVKYKSFFGLRSEAAAVGRSLLSRLNDDHL